ncbi:MAG: SPOR domain-containing protein [Porticoccaceae bacterium]|nr:SPOR domain-containing protein [Porticoccaceae bacterium]
MTTHQDSLKPPYPDQPDTSTARSDSDRKVNLNLSPQLDALRQSASLPEARNHTLSSSIASTSNSSESENLGGSGLSQTTPTKITRKTTLFDLIALMALALTVTSGIFLWQITLRLNTIETAHHQISLSAPSELSTGAADEIGIETKARMEALEQDLKTLINDQDGQRTMRRQTEQLEPRLESLLLRLSHLEASNTVNKLNTAGSTDALSVSAGVTAPMPSIKPATIQSEGASPKVIEDANQTSVNQAKTNSIAAPNPWFVNLGTFSERTSAEKLHERATAIETGAEIITILANQRPLYRVRVSGFASQHTAELKAQELQTILSLSGIWIAPQ